MRDYLFHRLSPAGAPVADCTLSFEDDHAAIQHAMGAGYPHGCEVWCSYRQLGRFVGASTSSLEAAPTPEASIAA
jgi:hypothetical protein